MNILVLASRNTADLLFLFPLFFYLFFFFIYTNLYVPFATRIRTNGEIEGDCDPKAEKRRRWEPFLVHGRTTPGIRKESYVKRFAAQLCISFFFVRIFCSLLFSLAFSFSPSTLFYLFISIRYFSLHFPIFTFPSPVLVHVQ